MNSFASALREFILAKGIKAPRVVKDIARINRISEEQVFDFLDGTVKPTAEFMLRLARVYSLEMNPKQFREILQLGLDEIM